jgi:hypothetical protein
LEDFGWLRERHFLQTESEESSDQHRMELAERNRKGDYEYRRAWNGVKIRKYCETISLHLTLTKKNFMKRVTIP